MVAPKTTTKPGRNYKGEAKVYDGNLLMVRIFFAVIVADVIGKPGALPARVRHCRNAFVSYASEDERDVLGRIQGMQKRDPDLDVFYARMRLQSGEKWKNRLREEIVARDVLYLFWSTAARKSRWVNWEWRYALEVHGINFIDPVPLESPKKVRPPKELADELHFDDWMLAYIHPTQA